MKKRKGILFALFPVLITICLYVVFYSRIESKPNDAGFWFILALGMSIGVALTRFSQWSNTKKTDNNNLSNF
jgi:membrane protein CcdC involved in cytochrome C biogenesis